MKPRDVAKHHTVRGKALQTKNDPVQMVCNAEVEKQWSAALYPFVQGRMVFLCVRHM